MSNPVEEALVEEYRRLAYHIARDYFVAGGDVDDVKQEALIGLMKGIRSFRPDGGASLRNFLGIAIRRQLVTAVLTASRRKHGPLNDSVRELTMSDGDKIDVAAGITDRDSDPADVLDRRLALRAAVSAVRELTPRERVSLDVHLSEETYRAAAERLGITAKSIDNGLQRARHKVSASLDEAA